MPSPASKQPSGAASTPVTRTQSRCGTGRVAAIATTAGAAGGPTTTTSSPPPSSDARSAYCGVGAEEIRQVAGRRGVARLKWIFRRRLEGLLDRSARSTMPRGRGTGRSSLFIEEAASEGKERHMAVTRDELVARLVRAGELEVSGEDQVEVDTYFA